MCFWNTHQVKWKKKCCWHPQCVFVCVWCSPPQILKIHFFGDGSGTSPPSSRIEIYLPSGDLVGHTCNECRLSRWAEGTTLRGQHQWTYQHLSKSESVGTVKMWLFTVDSPNDPQSGNFLIPSFWKIMGLSSNHRDEIFDAPKSSRWNFRCTQEINQCFSMHLGKIWDWESSKSDAPGMM